MAVTERDKHWGWVSYSCQLGQHDQCTTASPQPTRLVAPGCSDSCHDTGLDRVHQDTNGDTPLGVTAEQAAQAFLDLAKAAGVELG